jgi:hypothetical protein
MNRVQCSKSIKTNAVLPLLAITFMIVAGVMGDDFHQTKILKTSVSEPVWTAEQRSHWSFQLVKNPQLPVTKNMKWVRNPIDAFTLSQMEGLGFTPSEEASRQTLIRRATFDLTGLPPTPAEVEAFLADTRPDAYERLIDDLLNRKSYGERWARWWLDLARYAESDGYKSDDVRPNAWRYRDWVIDSLNNDMPYDRFVSFQIAGDEIEPNSPEAFIATGLNRLYPYESNNMVPGLNRQLILDDITDTNASLFMGLTVGCARCHDHKYDPISQKDYYRFEAIFGGLSAKDDYLLGSPMEIAFNASLRSEFESRRGLAEKRMTDIEQPYWAGVIGQRSGGMSQSAQKALAKSPVSRTEADIAAIRKAMQGIKITAEDVVSAMSPADRSSWQKMKKEAEAIEKQKPVTQPTAIGMTEQGPKPEPVRFLVKGNFHNQGEVIEPGFLSILSDRRVIDPKPTIASTSGRRQELAEWLTSPEHPLTSRVLVNRVWHQHFGRGIVTSLSDFGTQGMEPSHPELLDWLSFQFMQNGWSLKKLHRLIMTSSTYRLSSVPTAKVREEDPDNELFSHQMRRRIDAEMVRDSVLFASGRLNQTYGGPSVRPPLPDGVKATGWKTDEDPSSHQRRSIYIFAQRNVRYPFLEAFDLPDSNLTCPERLVSVNAPQALMMLNSDFAEAQATELARRLLAENPPASDLARLEQLWLIALGRRPDVSEQTRMLKLLADLRAKNGTGETKLELREWSAVAHVVLNLNEFIYVD